jgi:hypothetical protein
MAKPLHLDIVTGIAERVELFNEPAAAQASPPAKGRARGDRKAAPPARGVNAMRVILKDVATSKDREFVIRNSTVQVHERHRVTVIRAKQNRSKDLRIVAVVNQSTGQWEDRPHVIDFVSTPRPFFGPLWKAAGLSIALAALVFLALQIFAPSSAPQPAPAPQAIEQPVGPEYGRGGSLPAPQTTDATNNTGSGGAGAQAPRNSGGAGRIFLAILWGVVAYPIFWGAMQIVHRMTHRNRTRLSKELLRAEIDHQVAIATAMAGEKEG